MRIKRLILSGSILLLLGGVFSVATPKVFAQDVGDNPNFYTSLYDVVSTSRNYDNGQGGIQKFLQKIPGFGGGSLDINAGAQTLSDFIVEIIVKLIIPIFIFVGILLAILGFFKIMTNDTSEELKKGRDFLLRGVIGVLVMVAAGWIVTTLVGTNGTGGIIGSISTQDPATVSGAVIAGQLYGQLLFPLLKVLFSLILGIMFMLATVQGFKYLFNGEEGVQKKSLQILLFTVMGILVIILAKTIVEAVYGPYEEVISGGAETVTPGGGVDIGQVGQAIFTNPNFDVLYIILNRMLGLSTVIIMVLIIYMGYLLLFTPTSEETMGKIKKTLGRIFGGILLMGAAYLIANFVIIK